jgi:hypothetical protein
MGCELRATSFEPTGYQRLVAYPAAAKMSDSG